MNPDVLAPYTPNIAQDKKYESRINAVYNVCLVLWVGGSQLYFHYIFSFHRKTHLRCISSVLLHYNCKINANIQDVYHRLNLERALKGRYPLVLYFFCIMVIRFYTKNLKSFQAKMKAWQQFFRILILFWISKINVTALFLLEMTWNFLCRILEP